MPLVGTDSIAAAQNGDREAFARLVGEHHPRVILLCRSLLGATPVAEDGAQDVFLKVFERIGSFDGRSQFSSWLHSIAANHCLDVLRKIKRQKTESLEGIQHSDSGSEISAVDAKYEVAVLLKDLPESQKSAVILREMQGYSYEEIAAALECTLDSVKARLRRAREHMADKMRHLGGPADV